MKNNRDSGGTAVICVSYHPHYVDATVASLDTIAAENNVRQTIFVANQRSAMEALTTKLAGRDEVSIVQHDNRGMEFGALQAGLERLLTTHDPEWVIFANDSFSIHNSFGSMYRKRLRSEISRTIEHPAILGQIVSIPRAFRFGAFSTHRWMTTHLFALNRAARKETRDRVYFEEVDLLIREVAEMAEFFSPELHFILREHLEAWLFRARPGWHWYASDPLTEANMKKMAAKGRSVLQEKYISALLEGSSAEFIDFNELSVREKVIRNLERRIFDARRKHSQRVSK